MGTLSPMMQQYFRIKEKHKDHLLFFRLGDFYEMFFDDALTASKALGLTLTGRDCGLSERAPMCGVPYHSCEGYIARLIRQGYKVAICEQMEDPLTAKGVVSREVVRVITAGTLMENDLLQEDVNNYICCICVLPGGMGMAFADISTGEMNVLEPGDMDTGTILSELARYMPREVVFNSGLLDKPEIAQYMQEKLSCTAELLDDEHFTAQAAESRVLAHFGKQSMSELQLQHKPFGVIALGALLVYLDDTQKTGLERLITLNIQEDNRCMALDAATQGHLELVAAQRGGGKRGTLLGVLDKTRCPMGKRLIRTWIVQPLIHLAEIEHRLDAVEELIGNELLCADIAENLGGISDMERLMTRIVYGSAGPKEYKNLQSALAQLPGLKRMTGGLQAQFLQAIHGEIDPLEDIYDLLDRSIKFDAPATFKEGGVIADGYNEELDRLRLMQENVQQFLAQMENEEKERTGIKNLKIRYNRVYGYYIEVTKSNLDQVPDDYIRRQTLTNSERYITQPLKELEEQLLSAGERTLQLERELFEAVRKQVIDALPRIQRSALAVARLDVFQSFARVSMDNHYVRPAVHNGDALDIREGRHPVVEQLHNGVLFVPNDTLLDGGEHQIAVITGPNMAGKSTYMRQTALIVLMAQIGCFVPAESASISIVDGIYTRIGAADDLTAGRSTFMVEMVEVADILNNATSRSLLLLDEIGRGTSTYDGMSIARAVIEYIAGQQRLGAKTMFSTHYHELTEMEADLAQVKNYNVAVKKRGEDITFLYKIVRGGADDSFGVEVAKLAGVPDWVIRRAYEVLDELEADEPAQSKVHRARVSDEEEIQIRLPQVSELERMIKEIDLNTYTPLEALTLLYKLKEKVAD